jgi:hypothetical protein
LNGRDIGPITITERSSPFDMSPMLVSSRSPRQRAVLVSFPAHAARSGRYLRPLQGEAYRDAGSG